MQTTKSKYLENEMLSKYFRQIKNLIRWTSIKGYIMEKNIILVEYK